METRARYVLVGAFMLTLVGAAIGFVIWLARTDFEEAPTPYVIYFRGSVTGLALGSSVRYRGVGVGSVTDIRIDPTNVERIRVTIQVAKGTPVKTDTVATLGLQGVTGLAFIQLEGGLHESQDLRPAAGERLAVIPSRASGFEQVLESAPELVQKAVILVDRLGHVFTDANLLAVAESLENVRTLTATMANRADRIESMLVEGSDAVRALKTATENFGALSGDLRKRTGPLSDDARIVMGDLRTTLARVSKAAENIDRVSQELNAIAAENRRPIQDFSSGGLYELAQFIAEARVLVAGLSRLAAQIERNPARFFFGDTQKGFEAK
jgi:phospholipid/cholesterol/gamma-HCH transport system substrate-binding protein